MAAMSLLRLPQGRVLAAASAAAGAGLLFVLLARRRSGSQRHEGGSCGDCGCGSSDCCESTGEDEEEVVDDASSMDDLEELAEHADTPVPGTVRDGRVAVARRPGAAQAGDRDEDRRPELPGKQRVYVKTMGCAHNNSDSEVMMGLLQEYGYQLVNQLDDADVCLVNSCTVKNPSQDSATNLVKRAQSDGKAVVLTGCVPTADSTLAEGLQGVSMLGVTQIDRVVEVVEQALQGNTVQLLGKRRIMPALDLPKVRKNKCVEIIPISGGCLGNCSYCKTKHARGKLSSYTEDAIANRALKAAAEGASEIWLASEDTGAYGIDIGTNIARLLEKVADSLPEGVMLKVGMTNPPYMLAHIDAVAKVLQRPNVFAFIHIPVQSGSDRVLRDMVREYTNADFCRLVDGLREQVPDILIATDVICGFPTEGEEDHADTLALVRKYKFPVLNISQFYARPGTAAARMRRLPGHVGKARSTEMTQLFDSYETNRHLVGTETRVWFSDTETKHGQTIGHTKGYVKVVVPRNDELLGRNAMVRLSAATKWHVQGEVLSPSQ